MEDVEQLEREGLIGSASVEQALEHIVLVACIAVEELVPVQNEHSLEFHYSYYNWGYSYFQIVIG